MRQADDKTAKPKVHLFHITVWLLPKKLVIQKYLVLSDRYALGSGCAQQDRFSMKIDRQPKSQRSPYMAQIKSDGQAVMNYWGKRRVWIIYVGRNNSARFADDFSMNMLIIHDGKGFDWIITWSILHWEPIKATFWALLKKSYKLLGHLVIMGETPKICVSPQFNNIPVVWLTSLCC